MSDVKETLRDLMLRRLREMGRARGDAGPLSLRQVHQRLPVNSDGKYVVSYETFRQIHTGEHSGVVTDLTAEALALALEVDVDEVYVAAGQRVRLGEFRMPDYAAQLDRSERRVVLGVVDAILAASGRATVGPYDADLDALPDEESDPAPVVGLRPVPDAARKEGKKPRKK